MVRKHNRAYPRFLQVALVSAVLAIFALSSVAVAAVDDIRITPHNLGASGGVGSGGDGTNFTNDTTEVCVFCHTPHGSDIGAPVPLWNRALPTGTSYQTYASLGTTTLDSAEGETGSVSLACLSCHDGGQAFDVLINAPGMGGYDPAGASQNWVFTEGNQLGVAPLSGITYIGTDLRNDHPISIQYGGGGITSTAPVALTTDPDFVAPQTAIINGTTVWWLDTTDPDGTIGQRDKTDMVLYTRTAAYTGQTDAEPFVECASCHNPHTTNDLFLRIENTGSAVCLACHTK